MQKIVIFASGNGTNAERIVEYFSENPNIEVSKILSNRTTAFVLERAKNLGIPASTFSRADFYHSDKVLKQIEDADLVVLAGFLWLIPQNILKKFPNRIINIHPALLPKYGGKGMFGAHVHKAVVAAKERESGITIHLVNEHYDEGEVLFQAKCQVQSSDNPDDVAKKIHTLEYLHFPKIVNSYIQKLPKL